MKRLFLSFFFLLFATTAVFAYGPSSINPQLPANQSGLTSFVIRNQFLAAYNDVTNIYSILNGFTSTPPPGGSTNSIQYNAGGNTFGGISLSSGQIIIGQSGKPQAVNVSGDATLDNTGDLILAEVNSDTGSFGSSTSIPNFTVNDKGLITAAGSNVVIAPAGTLTGTTLNSSVVNSSLTSVGTLGSLTVSGVATALNFNATGSGANILPVGTTGQRPSPFEGMLRDNSTLHEVEAYINGTWEQLATTAGTVTSVAVTGDGVLFNGTFSGSPITSSGTFNFNSNLIAQVKNTVLAGPTTGSNAAPTFRALVGTDLPNPAPTTLGGIESITAVAHQFLTSINTSGAPAQAQPAFTDISGVATVAQGGTGATSLGCGLSNSGSVLNGAQCPGRVVTASTDSITSADLGSVIYYNSSSAIAVSIAQAITANGLGVGFGVTVNNENSGTTTITPTTSVINGAATLVIPPFTGCYFYSNGTDYLVDYAACWPVAKGTGFTAGSVVFAGTSGVLSQDNSNFFWDATNHRLGIQATSPSQALVIGNSGNVLIGGGVTIGSATFSSTRQLVVGSGASTLLRGILLQTDSTFWALDNNGASSSPADRFSISNGSEAFSIRGNGNVGIGSTNPAVKLDVAGAVNGLTYSATGTTADTLPAGTTGQRPGSPVEGNFRDNTTLHVLEGYLNGGWQSVLSATGGFSDARYAYVYNYNPSANFNKWRLALAKVRDGTANARVLFIGDSTTAGIGSTLGSTYPNVGAHPTRVSQIMNSTITPTANALAVVPSDCASNPDGRWVAGSGWALSTFGGGNCGSYQASGTTGNLVFTPNAGSGAVTYDSFYVYYLGSATLGVITATATGGSPVVITASGLSSGTYRTLVTASAANTTNTLTISSTGTNNYILAVEPVLSTKSQVLVGNAGYGSSTAQGWSNTGNFSSQQFIETIAPDLCVVSLGINDAGASTAAATYSGYMQTIITGCLASGDVIIEDFPPSSGTPYTTFEPQYLPYLYSLASSNNATYVSVWGLFGGTFNTNYMANTLHPNNDGYWDWAAFDAAFIENPQ